jgi:hypothetical protein
MKTTNFGRNELLVIIAAYLFGMTNLPTLVSLLLLLGIWLALGGNRFCYLAYHTVVRDLRLLLRGLKLLFRMAYVKAMDLNMVKLFRKTVARYPNRVMYVNATNGTEWTYSKVLISYYFKLYIKYVPCVCKLIFFFFRWRLSAIELPTISCAKG